MGKGRSLFGVAKEGRRIPIEVGLTPLESNGETFAIASVVDLSETLKGQGRFKAIVEGAPNAMIMVNQKGEITLVNRQGEVLFGYTEEELLGQKIETLIPQKFRDAHPGHVKSFFKHPKPRAMGAGRDLFGRKKSGKKFPVEVGLMPLQSEEGNFVVSSVVDISERVQSQKALIARNEELQQFAYRTSHDLKAPLRSIAGLAGFMIEDLDQADQQESIKHNAERILKLSEKLLHFISDILETTKADHVDSEISLWDARRDLYGIKERLISLFDEGKVQFSVHLSHKIPLYLDVSRLNQILENLISNSLKYKDTQKEECYIDIKTHVSNDVLTVEVKDNGLGIPENRQGEVFQMFKRFHSTSVDGSGLGLYLVKKQVEKCGGEIDFESSPEGSTFRVQMPLTPPDKKSL
tara:strand:- start:42 stop:1265 length:1224 start_codon:yes stop_codon:yes gene_type:complete